MKNQNNDKSKNRRASKPNSSQDAPVNSRLVSLETAAIMLETNKGGVLKLWAKSSNPLKIYNNIGQEKTHLIDDPFFKVDEIQSVQLKVDEIQSVQLKVDEIRPIPLKEAEAIIEFRKSMDEICNTVAEYLKKQRAG